MKSFILMLTFLTRIPIPVKSEFNDEDFKKGIWWMPVVGLIIGLILHGIVLLIGGLFTPLTTAFILLALYMLITGGLHVDGLADTFDAFGSNRPRERMLEIMKDSRMGTFGVLSIVLYCIGMVTLLGETGLYLFFPLVGRCAALLVCTINSYAREDGLGKTIIDHTTWGHVIFGLSLTLPYMILIALSSDFHIVVCFILSIALALTIIALWSRHLSKKLGGITGDIIGASIEGSQLLFLTLFQLLIMVMGS